MSKPDFTVTAGVYSFLWQDEGIAMRLDRLHEGAQGLRAEVVVESTIPDIPSHLHQAQLNLSSTSARGTLVKTLSRKAEQVDWETLVEQACTATLRRHREGEPVVDLRDNIEIQPVLYLLDPLIPEGHPTIFYGDGGSGKSTLVLLLSLIISSGWHENPYHVSPNGNTCTGLILDWETDKREAEQTLKKLAAAQGIENYDLKYKRCYQTLGDDLPEILRTISEKNIRFCVIDSVAAACGGDITKAEYAMPFMGHHCRQLGITTIMVAHHGKTEGAKTIYGSVFFRNYARSVFEVVSNQTEGDETLDIALFHRKANFSALQKPTGFRFSYFDDGIVVNRQNVADVAAFVEKLPLRQQIANLLRQRALSSDDIASEVGISEPTVKTTLYRHKNLFLRLDNGLWGIRYRE